MERQNKKSYNSNVFVIMMLLLFVVLMSFYKVMINQGDNIEHLKLTEAMLNTHINGGYLIHMLAYPLYHFTTKIVSFVCFGDIYFAAIVVLTLSNIASAIIMRQFLNMVCACTDRWKGYLLDILAVLYLFFETLAGPLTDGRIYQRQCGPNPWHNPTITFVRPLGLLSLYFFIKYMASEESRDRNKSIILFSIFSTLSVIAKPSFMMVFLPALGLFSFMYWIKDYKRNFIDVRRIFVSVLPTLAVIVLQFLFFQFYNDGNVSPVKFQFGGFSEFSFYEIIKVSIATFPVPIIGLFLYGEEIVDSIYSRIGYIALVFGAMEMFLFTNGNTGDFPWGYDLAVGFITMVTLGTSLGIKEGGWKRILLFIVFSYQVIVGIYYFFRIYNGEGYWI